MWIGEFERAMKRTVAVVLAAAMALSIIAPVGVALGAVTETPSDDRPGTSDVAPGEQFSGVVGVQGAELDGEVESRAFERRVAAAETDDEVAAAVAAQVNASEERLAALRAERERLREARENGSIGEGEYRARLAQLGAQLAQVERLVNDTQTVASDLPAETLERNGVNTSAIQTLQENASELSGGEVSEAARDIAGDRPGTGPAGNARGSDEAGPPDDAPGGGVGGPVDEAENETETASDDRPGGGPPNDAPGAGRSDDSPAADARPDNATPTGDDVGSGVGNETETGDADAAVERAAEAVSAARERVAAADEATASDDGPLGRAEAELADAEEALSQARAAADAGDSEAAIAHANDARASAERAAARADRLLEGGGDGGSGDAGNVTDDGGG